LTLFTIGFTKKSAEKFFGLLRGSGAKRLVDVRLNNVSQLAGYAKKQVPREVLADGCLLCSEDKPHHCHRRLVAEYLEQHWGDLEIKHLV
jgi:uncharacterized protein (DUF488 family)